MFTHVREYNCICDKSSINTFVASEEAACNLSLSDVTQLLNCIVGNVGFSY